MTFKLNDEQIETWKLDHYCHTHVPYDAYMEGFKDGADKASEHTLREVIKWGEEWCEDHCNINGEATYKRECCFCWEELKQSLASELKENDV